MSYELVKIETDVPIEFDLKDCLFLGIKKETTRQFLREMEFFLF